MTTEETVRRWVKSLSEAECMPTCRTKAFGAGSLLKTGDFLDTTIDTAIRLRDKVLLILSETLMASAWVTKEVRTALAEEKAHPGKAVLFPVRLDDTVMETTEQWAYDIKRTRHIGDFTHWKEHDAYTKALERLLRDLKVEKG